MPGRLMEQDLERLFVSGDYVHLFRPDEDSNPFWKLYAQKRQAVLGMLPGTGLKVLDIGAGMGRIAIPLAERHEVTACDLSLDMLLLARRASKKPIELVVADARRLPFPENSFDAVLCLDVLPHLPNPEVALSEARRVLRPGGTFVVDSSNSVPLWTLAFPGYLGRRPARWLRIWRAGGVLPEWSTRVWHRRFSTFVTLLNEAGFSVRSTRGFGPRICPKWHLAVAG